MSGAGHHGNHLGGHHLGTTVPDPRHRRPSGRCRGAGHHWAPVPESRRCSRVPLEGAPAPGPTLGERGQLTKAAVRLLRTQACWTTFGAHGPHHLCCLLSAAAGERRCLSCTAAGLRHEPTARGSPPCRHAPWPWELTDDRLDHRSDKHQTDEQDDDRADDRRHARTPRRNGPAAATARRRDDGNTPRDSSEEPLPAPACTSESRGPANDARLREAAHARRRSSGACTATCRKPEMSAVHAQRPLRRLLTSWASDARRRSTAGRSGRNRRRCGPDA